MHPNEMDTLDPIGIYVQPNDLVEKMHSSEVQHASITEERIKNILKKYAN